MQVLFVSVCVFVLSAASFLPQERPRHLFPIKVNGKMGFIDQTGRVVIEPRLNGAYEFSEGLAAAYVGEGQFDEGYIDQDGNVAIQPKFNIASEFSEGLAWAGIDPNRKPYKMGPLTLYTSQSTHSFDYEIGFIDKSGKWVIEPQFKRAGDFSEGLALVQTKEGKYGFVDATGNFVIQPTFEWAGSFSEGLAAVFNGRKYGYIDRSGRTVIKPHFTHALDFSGGLACVKIGGRTRRFFQGSQVIKTDRQDLRYGFVNKLGKIVVHLTASRCEPFSEGLARVEMNGKAGFIDNKGAVVISPDINAIGDFSEGLALVLLPGDKESFGFIDHAGTIVIRTNYSVVDDFKNGLAQFRQDDPERRNDIVYSRYGYIDKLGKVVWQPTR